jgi:RNA methyltransferase, TrmH family
MLEFAHVTTISSRQNPLVRAFRTLADTPDPSGERLLLDGPHLVRDAHRASLPFEVVVVAAAQEALDSEEAGLARTLRADGVNVITATDSVMSAISPVRAASAIVGIARRRRSDPSSLCRTEHGFIVAAVDVQDPGNVGSLLRAAEAGGVTGAFVCGASANPFSWKALRGAMGSSLRLPVVEGLTADAVLACMETFGVRTIAAVPRDGSDPSLLNWSGSIGLFVGGEGPGLDPEVIRRCSARVSIPMAPAVESLNVAVAGAILVYAARQQRAGNGPT